MRMATAIAALSIRQNLKSPIVLGLLMLAPLVLIYLLGEALREVFPGGRSYEYFTVFVLTQMLGFGSFLGMWAIHKDRQNRTMERLRVAPVAIGWYLAGAFAGGYLSLTALMLLVLVGAAVALGVPVQGSGPALAGLLATGCVFSTAFGMAVGVVVRQQQPAAGIMNITIPLLILLGGGYTPIPDDGLLYTLSFASPLRWTHRALTERLMSGAGTYDLSALLLCPLIGLALLIAAAVVLRRRWR